MSHIRQYDYPNTIQRKFVTINAILTGIILGSFFSECLWYTNTLFPYKDSMLVCGLFLLCSHLVGSVFGRFLFSKITRSRIVYIITETFFFVLAGLWYFKGKKFNPEIDTIIRIYLSHPVPGILILTMIPFLAGIKNCYFLKVSSGIFFDEKRGTAYYVLSFFGGFAAGAVGYFCLAKFGFPFLPGMVFVLLIPFVFLIKAHYSPKPFFAQNVEETVVPETDNVPQIRDDLFFSYLNYSCILIYLFLSGAAVSRFYGDFLNIRFAYLSSLFLFIGAGFIIPFIFRIRLLHSLYFEMLYPFLFIIYYIIISSMHESIPLTRALLLFAPAGILFGISIHYSIRSVTEKYSQLRISDILYLSIFVLPIPIIASLSILPLSGMTFMIIFYAVALFNIALPGLYLAQKNVSEFKKGLFFIVIALSVPFFIIIHIYFGLSFSQKPFIERSSGLESVTSINYASDYIQKNADAKINGIAAFHASDQSIRGMKQSVAALSLFCNPDRDTVLFIDGNRPFFANPVEQFYKNGMRIDYVPGKFTNEIRVPTSGSRELATETTDILTGLNHFRESFVLVVDIPNLYDQNTDAFRFSSSYWRTIKNRLGDQALAAQILDISRSDGALLGAAVASFRNEFENSAAFLFGETLLLVGSSRKNSLALNDAKIQSLKSFIAKDPSVSILFYSELHCLSHLIVSNLAQLRGKEIPVARTSVLKTSGNIEGIFPDNLVAGFEKNHSVFAALYSDPLQKNMMLQQVSSSERQLSLIKMIESASLARDYESETKDLIELRKIGEYNPVIRQYAVSLLSFRETSYNEIALQYEKEKLWEEAAKVYRSILIINPNNFDANYKMSVLSLTLQDINGAFSYLRTAMNLQGSNPNAMHQMGVLLFSTGKYTEAIEYFLKALALQKYDAQTYYSLGLCYEELGRLAEAQQYYTQALMKDPTNQDITTAAERLKLKIQKDRDQWQMPEQKNQTDVEKGEDFPLPINKSAKDVRLKDEDPLMKKQENK